jgi:hypothetical protein
MNLIAPLANANAEIDYLKIKLSPTDNCPNALNVGIVLSTSGVESRCEQTPMLDDRNVNTRAESVHILAMEYSTLSLRSTRGIAMFLLILRHERLADSAILNAGLMNHAKKAMFVRFQIQVCVANSERLANEYHPRLLHREHNRRICVKHHHLRIW